jgi:hypothetical protein
VSEEGAGVVVAVLTGKWEKPSWRAVNVVGIVDSETGVTAYMIAQPGSDSIDVTGVTPTSGDTIPTTTVNPPPITGDLKTTPRPTQTTAPSTVTIPDYYDPHDKPDIYTPPEIVTVVETVTIIETVTETVIESASAPETPSIEVPSGGDGYGGYGGYNEFSWLPVSLGWGLFNGYRMLWPIYIFGRTIDLAFVVAVLFSVMLVIVGAALSRKKKQ